MGVMVTYHISGLVTKSELSVAQSHMPSLVVAKNTSKPIGRRDWFEHGSS